MLKTFQETLSQYRVTLARDPVTILQVNIGKLCNQACHHCHVEAGPRRTEILEARTAERVLELVAKSPNIATVDLTGGAPELNPQFRALVRGVRGLGRQVIDRCNLTVLFEQGQETTAEFLAEQGVQVVASLPCYSKKNVDRQRGRGVFDKSILGLQKLNALGYGHSAGLVLDLVYNPLGATLPPPQTVLEADYRRELRELFGIEFTRLFALTNMPIRRFQDQLRRSGREASYHQLLVESFSPTAAAGVMCRSMVSVGWDGQLYDCDFNQMLEMPLGGRPRTIWEIDSVDDLQTEPIAVGKHCYGCTAGAGSSCQGALLGNGNEH